MRKVLIMLLVAAGVTLGQVSFGIQIGPPPPPRVLPIPRSPGAEFVWIPGYWYPNGRHYRWHAGYWTRPPYGGAHWVEPHHDGARYFSGYWDGEHGRLEHDHHWDRRRERDYRR